MSRLLLQVSCLQHISDIYMLVQLCHTQGHLQCSMSDIRAQQ